MTAEVQCLHPLPLCQQVLRKQCLVVNPLLYAEHCGKCFKFFISSGTHNSTAGAVETEKDSVVFASHVLSLPFVCGETLAKNKYNQRSEKMQKQRKTVQQD